MKWCLSVLLILPLYGQTAIVAGVVVGLGMAKDNVLARFRGATNIKVVKVEGPGDVYVVSTNGNDPVASGGSLEFKAGKLTRIVVDHYEASDQPARTLANALYNAVASAEATGIVRVWTETTKDANHPTYGVHLLFKDREVVIETIVNQAVEVSLVRTYFPR